VKKFILLIIISLISGADTLYVKKNRCILDNYYFANSRFHYTYSSTGNEASTKTFKSTDLEYGYEFVNNQCKKKERADWLANWFFHFCINSIHIRKEIIMPFVVLNLTNDFTLNFFMSIFTTALIPILFGLLIVRLFLGSQND